MRTYDELTAEEQKEAVNQEYAALLGDVSAGVVRFNDALNGDEFQAAIDQAIAKADWLQTPWFAHEYVAEAVYSWDVGDGTTMSETVGEALRSMAECGVDEAFFPDPDERVIRL
jgi:Zn-dependent metalloprotease